MSNDHQATSRPNAADTTLSNNARPATDDSVVEGIDEANPGVTGSPRPDAVPASKSNPADKAA